MSLETVDHSTACGRHSRLLRRAARSQRAAAHRTPRESSRRRRTRAGADRQVVDARRQRVRARVVWPDSLEAPDDVLGRRRTAKRFNARHLDDR